MTLFVLLLAVVVPVPFLSVIARMYRGERLRSVAVDRNRFPVAFGHRGELVLGAVAAARVAADPAARPAAYLLLATAALLPVLGRGATARASRALLGVLGALAAVIALGDVADPDCGGGPATVMVTMALLAVTGTAFTMRSVLGGWFGGSTGLSGLALAVFALAELVPLVLSPAGIGLLSHSTGLGARILLVSLLAIVAAAAGLRPNASTGALGVAVAVLSLGVIGIPGPCGTSAGWLLTSAVLVAAVRALATGARRWWR